jgi:hypothetical protein
MKIHKLDRIRLLYVGNKPLSIDFRALQKQRSTLTCVIEGDIPGDTDIERLRGLQEFLDEVCDAAEQALGSEIVYGRNR